MTSGSGIYVHFPFCVSRCSYCDFVSHTPTVIPQRTYTDAVVRELERCAYLLSGAAATLYFGGGTPSLWEADELARFVDAARLQPGLLPGVEVTLEANPSEVCPRWIDQRLSAGVNRISLGVQSLSDELLRRIDRRHDSSCALEAIEAVAHAGLETFSVDFIFGLPGQTRADWQSTLERVVDFGIPHLSVYGLTLEPSTPLGRRVRQRQLRLPADGLQADMLFDARRTLVEAGYEHYEVSNYAMPGHRARHNSAYWSMVPYLGIGAGSHGFVPPVRWANTARFDEYIEHVESGRDPIAFRERLDPRTLSFERVMTGLRRLDKGVDLRDDWSAYAEAVDRQVALGNLEVEGTTIRLTESGLRYMDSVLMDLMP